MATFPTAADFVRRAPNPGREIGTYRPAKAADEGSEAAQTLYEQGRQTQQAARDLAVLGQQFDDTAAQDALNKLRLARQELTYDPEKGFRRFKGGDVLQNGPGGKPLHVEIPDAFRLKAEELGGKLLSPIARAKFNQAVTSEMAGFKRDFDTWRVGQAEQYEAATYKDTQAGTLNEVTQVADDPEKVEALAIRAERAAFKRAQQLGLPGEASAAGARSNVLRTAIETRLNRGDGRAALSLFDAAKDRLDGGDRVALESRLKSTQVDVASDDWIQLNKPNERRQAVRRFWEAKGYSPEAASALTGNFQSESWTFDPNAINPRDGRDGSDSVGVGQWNGPRAKALQKFAADNKMDPRSLRTQLEFANWELENTETGTRDKLKGAKSLDEATRAAVGFFRPAGWTLAQPELANSYGIRARRAQAALNDNAGVGFDKAGSKALVLTALNDPSLSPQERAAVTQKLDKESSALEAARAAEIKGLKDTLEATQYSMIVSPSTYQKGSLLALAERLDQAGEKSEAANTRLLADNEDTILGYLSSPKAAQDATKRRIIEGLLSGKAKALASGLLTADEKDRTEFGRLADSEFGGLKEAVAGKVPLSKLGKKLESAVTYAVQSGNQVKAQEIIEWATGQNTAEAVAQGKPTEIATTIDAMRQRVAEGDAANGTIKALRFLEQIDQRHLSDFSKDAYATGTALYPEVGQPVQVNWADTPENIAVQLSMKSHQARQISSRREGIPVIPFSDAEVSLLRNKVDTGSPEDQRKVMSALSMLPPDMVPRVAAALAGKEDAGDPLSRSYAAAMSFYADKTPEQAAVADQILKGARILKEGGASGRKPAVTSEAWQTALQDRMSNVFVDMGAKVPAMISDAVASHYVWQMWQAGRQGEKPDTDVLDKSIKAVMGNAIIHNGQAILPPQKGMTRYDFENVLSRLTNGDLDGLKTGEGDQVTADVIRRRGVLTNVGDGLYKVRIPDPRRGGDLAEIVNPETGGAWLLDAKPLMQRTPSRPSYTPGTPMTAPLTGR